MTAVRLLAVVAAAGAALSAPAAGAAARAPTHAEREAIVRALPAGIRAIPVGCVHLNVRVSRSPRFAYVGPEFLNARPGSRCLRYAGNGFFVLRKTGRAWRVVYTGSELPACSRGIPRDLVRCRPA
jgi:hypothetical protein